MFFNINFYNKIKRIFGGLLQYFLGSSLIIEPFRTMYSQQDKQDNSEDFEQDVNMQGSTEEGNGYINKTHLIVNYLPQYMKDKDLYTMFVTQGPLDYVRIIKDYKTGYSYGYGFVKFQNTEDAAKAIEALNGVVYYSKRLKVSYARPPSDDIKKTNLYITNLPNNITEDDIDRIFSEYGDIVTRSLLYDKTSGMPRGVAFVRYATRDNARCAVQNLNGILLEGSVKPICVKVAEDRAKQKASYYESWPLRYQNQGPMRGTFPKRANLNGGRPPFNGFGRGSRFNPMMGNEHPMNSFI